MESLKERIRARIFGALNGSNESDTDLVYLLESAPFDLEVGRISADIAAMATAASEPPKPPELPDVTGVGEAFYASKDGSTAVMFRRSSIGNEMWATASSPWLARDEFTGHYQRLLPLRTVTVNGDAPMKTNKKKEN